MRNSANADVHKLYGADFLISSWTSQMPLMLASIPQVFTEGLPEPGTILPKRVTVGSKANVVPEAAGFTVSWGRKAINK